MRYLPPVHSPLSPGALLSAIATGVRGGGTARVALGRRLTDQFGGVATTLTASGTHALHAALCEVPVDSGRAPTVAMPAYSCFDLVSAAVGAGVSVKFYDVDPVTLGPDMAQLRGLVAERVSAVIASSLYGYPLDWPAIKSVCSGTLLIEDAAQGLGTGVGEHRGGANGAMSVLSFGRGKGWTGGGGGALIVRSTAPNGGLPATVGLGAPMSGLRTAGVTIAAWVLGRPRVYGIPASLPWFGLGETHYRDPSAPRDIPAFSAALVAATAVAAQGACMGRRQVAERWYRAFAERADQTEVLPSICQPVGGSSVAGFLRFAVLARNEVDAQSIHHAAARFGVTRGYPTPLHRLNQARAVNASPSNATFPGAELLSRCLLTLPTHHWVTDTDIATVADLVVARGKRLR